MQHWLENLVDELDKAKKDLAQIVLKLDYLKTMLDPTMKDSWRRKKPKDAYFVKTSGKTFGKR